MKIFFAGKAPENVTEFGHSLTVPLSDQTIEEHKLTDGLRSLGEQFVRQVQMPENSPFEFVGIAIETIGFSIMLAPKTPE